MKKLFRKLFGIKYTYFVIAEFNLKGSARKMSLVCTRNNPLCKDTFDEFRSKCEKDFRVASPENADYFCFISSITRL